MNTLLIESTSPATTTTRNPAGDTWLPRQTRATSRARILYVDDDDCIRGLSREVLERQGYQVDSVADGREALASLQDGRHQLLITDQNMPHLTGLELVAQVRRAGLSLPILMTSSFVDLSQIPIHTRPAITALLPKPFVAAELLGTVSRILKQKNTMGPAELAINSIVRSFSTAQSCRNWGINE